MAKKKKKVKEKKPSVNISDKYQDAAQRAESGMDIDRIKLEKGENIIKLVSSDFTESYVVFVKDTEGNLRRVSLGKDKSEYKDKYQVLLDDDEVKVQHRYYFNAIQGQAVKVKDKKTKKVKKKYRFDSQVKLLEVGVKIFKQIAGIQMDDEYPDVDKIYLKIKRTGDGVNTDYTVLPGKEVSDPDDLSDFLDLEKIAEETPLNHVHEILGLESVDEEEEEKPTKKGKKKPSKKDKKKPSKKKKVKEEEEEEEEELEEEEEELEEDEDEEEEDEEEEEEDDDLGDLDDLDDEEEEEEEEIN
jgi:hypothetical protein